MKRYLLIGVSILIVLSGCASGVKKRFTVVTDPPDAVIRVVSGSGLSEDTYRSPAKISVRLPIDSILLAKNVLEVSRDAYKPKKMQLRDIRDNEAVNVKLDKIVHYTLKYRLLNPVQSDEIKFQDKILSLSFVAAEREFQMNLTNLTPYPVRILWDRSEYTDVNNRQRRLIHSGVRHQDRNNPVPAQTVPPKGSVQQSVMSVDSVVYNAEKKAYENRPLFPLDSDIAAELKGRVFYLFIPVEIERQIIPYNFKIEIADAVKQGA
jgi:hypothetical protein